jgi:hypothetical protein
MIEEDSVVNNLKNNVKKLENWIKESNENTTESRIDALMNSLLVNKRALVGLLKYNQGLIGTNKIPYGLPKEIEEELINNRGKY